jgi:hypothetical protein
MVWLSALWHLLGAGTDLSPAILSPAALAGFAFAGVAVALLALALAVRVAHPATPRRSAVRTARRPRVQINIVVRYADPDAPGRSRPRAPSRVPAVA